jgi:restriction endonuclease S subunit
MGATNLASLIELSRDGEWGKGEPKNGYVEMAVIRGTDFDSVRHGQIDSVPTRYIKEHIADYKKLYGGEILVETAGGSQGRITGRSIYLKPEIVGRFRKLVTCASFSRFIRLKNSESINTVYIYWLLQYLYHFGSMDKYHTQHTGVSRFQWTIFAENEVFVLPCIETQNTIAYILSAYDDLIENNLRRIKILEEMAQNLSREWFVNFRFPGHEKSRFVDSPLGRIPEGWVVANLKDICNITMGQSPKSDFYNEIGNGLPFHQGVSNFGARFPKAKYFCTMANRLANKGDILFSVRAPVGRINIANEKMIIGRGLSAITHKLGCQWFLYHMLKEIFIDEDTIGGGTIFKSVTKNDMETIKVITPVNELKESFESLVKPSERLIENIEKRITILRQTRDLLLPKLLSGEVDVSELDISVPEEAAS